MSDKIKRIEELLCREERLALGYRNPDDD